MKDEAYVVNLYKNESIRTHWIALYVNGGNITYFDSFGVEHFLLKKIKTLIGDKNIMTYIYKTQA